MLKDVNHGSLEAIIKLSRCGLGRWKIMLSVDAETTVMTIGFKTKTQNLQLNSFQRLANVIIEVLFQVVRKEIIQFLSGA